MLLKFIKWNEKGAYDFKNGKFPLIGNLLRTRNKFYTQWQPFNRRPKKLINENMICVVKGKEEFRLVSPIFR